jgi:thymidine phosphorylase
LLHKPGDRIQKGETLAVMHGAGKNLTEAEQLIKDSIQWSNEPVKKTDLIIETIL